MARKAKFKVGDRVMISKKSEYYCGDKDSSNPRDIVGTVSSYYTVNYHDTFTTKVDWDNGLHNSYTDKDLRLVTDEASNNEKDLTVDKEFVLQAYESACSTWKEKIEQKFPELFPKQKFAKLIGDNELRYGTRLYYRSDSDKYTELNHGIALIDGIAGGYPEVPSSAKYRGIYVNDRNDELDLELVRVHDGYAIVFKKKNS